MKKTSIRGIRVTGPDGSDYTLPIMNIALDKAEKLAGSTKNPKEVLVTTVLPEFEKNPKKITEWLEKMSPDKMGFIKVKQANRPSNEDLAKRLKDGVLE